MLFLKYLISAIIVATSANKQSFAEAGNNDSATVSEKKDLINYNWQDFKSLDPAELSNFHKQCFEKGSYRPQDMEKLISEPNTAGYLILDDKTPVGIIIFRNNYTYRNFTGNYLVTLGVHPNHRKKGIARLMLDKWINDTPNASTRFLHVAVSNTIAQKIYEKYGFVLEDFIESYYTFPEYNEDAYIYKLG